MSGRYPGRGIAAVGVAGSGLVLGHWLAYALGTPETSAREELLHATGHGYLPYATQVALIAGAVGLVASFVARLRHRGTRGSVRREAAALALAQSAGFVSMEAGERLLSGAPLHDLAHGPLLAIGLAVQILVAIAGAALLRLSERAADATERQALDPAAWQQQIVGTVVPSMHALATRPAMRTTASRAPPSLP